MATVTVSKPEPIPASITLNLTENEYAILAYTYRMFVGGDNVARNGLQDAFNEINLTLGLGSKLAKIKRGEVCVDIGMGDYLDTDRLLERLR